MNVSLIDDGIIGIMTIMWMIYVGTMYIVTLNDIVTIGDIFTNLYWYM